MEGVEKVLMHFSAGMLLEEVFLVVVEHIIIRRIDSVSKPEFNRHPVTAAPCADNRPPDPTSWTEPSENDYTFTNYILKCDRKGKPNPCVT